jgi:glycosyltransferase involved in cell wall biosynthesis
MPSFWHAAWPLSYGFLFLSSGNNRNLQNFFTQNCLEHIWVKLVSDILAKKEVDLPATRYFRCGDVDNLYTAMERLLRRGLTEIEKHAMRRVIADKYNWNKIAEQTIAVYRTALTT